MSIVRLLARDPPAIQTACSRLKLAAPVLGPVESIVGVKSGCAVKLAGCWNCNPLTHRGSPFLEMRRLENGLTSRSL
jgi:hypothetical protein